MPLAINPQIDRSSTAPVSYLTPHRYHQAVCPGPDTNFKVKRVPLAIEGVHCMRKKKKKKSLSALHEYIVDAQM